MSATIHRISGLHGANLAAFERVCAEIDAIAAERAESLLREMRRSLRYAERVAPDNIELADAFTIRAANKLALALGVKR